MILVVVEAFFYSRASFIEHATIKAFRSNCF